MSREQGKRRSVNEIRMPNDEALYYSLSRIKHPGVRAYISFIFLTGARAEEVLGQRRTIKERQGMERYSIEPLKKSDVEIKEGYMWVNNVPTFKRRDRPLRSIPVRIDLPQETKYYLLFKEHFDELKPDAYLFRFSRQFALRKLREVFDGHIHFLRSARATRLAVDYDLDAISLQKYFNWSQLSPAAIYAQKNLKDIVAKMNRV